MSTALNAEKKSGNVLVFLIALVCLLTGWPVALFSIMLGWPVGWSVVLIVLTMVALVIALREFRLGEEGDGKVWSRYHTIGMGGAGIFLCATIGLAGSGLAAGINDTTWFVPAVWVNLVLLVLGLVGAFWGAAKSPYDG